jgi:hypothetical protein
MRRSIGGSREVADLCFRDKTLINFSGTLPGRRFRGRDEFGKLLLTNCHSSQKSTKMGLAALDIARWKMCYGPRADGRIAVCRAQTRGFRNLKGIPKL